MNIILNIDSIDGMGKTTICNNITPALHEKFPDYEIFIVHNPDRKLTSGKVIDEYLKGYTLCNNLTCLKSDPFVVGSMFMQHYIDLVDRVPIDNDKNNIIVFDRSYMSTFAYQGTKALMVIKKYLDLIPLLHDEDTKIINVWLDPADSSFVKRALEYRDSITDTNNKHKDLFEKDIEFLLDIEIFIERFWFSPFSENTLNHIKYDISDPKDIPEYVQTTVIPKIVDLIINTI